MRVLLTGATGFVGKPLARQLFLAGHQLVILSRDAERAERAVGVKADYHRWDPLSGPPPEAATTGIDAVFNLMGENLGAGRWTESRKRAIYDSRVEGTRNLVSALNRAADAPLKAFVNFSAIGYYPANTGEVIAEDGEMGAGFAAEVCADWEAAAHELSAAERRVILRLGTVLGAGGGALQKLLPVFRAGAGGPVGSGRQMMSWIHLQDLVRLCQTCLEDDSYTGVYNAVAPCPVSNADFSRTLAAVMGRPALLPAPPQALKVAFGEMSQLVLDSQQIVSSRLPEAGFEYQYGDLRLALEEAAGLLPIGFLGESHLCDRYEDFVFIQRPIEEVFEFFCDPYNLEMITPPMLGFQVEKVSTDSIEKGTVIDYKLKLRGIPMRWRTLIKEWVPNDYFVDFQLRGPYRVWHHRHTFRSVAGGTAMIDRVDYSLPLGVAGALLGQTLVRRDIQAIFDHRRETILDLLSAPPAETTAVAQEAPEAV